MPPGPTGSATSESPPESRNAGVEGEACANCGTPLAGEWCHACGQKRFRPEHRTLRHLAGEFLAFVTDVDGRLLGTLKGLLRWPGRMAAAYLDGARRRYLSPLALFLLVNLAYFLAPPLSDFAPSLSDHVNLQPYSAVAGAVVSERLAERGIGFDEYAASFEARQSDLARSLVVLHVPVLALGLGLLHLFRHRPLADHVLVALYAMTIVLAAVVCVPPVLALGARAAGLGAETGSLVWRLGFLAVLFGYLFALLRGAYGQPGWLAALKLPMVLVAVAASHLVYRAALFGLVFAAT